ncbi:MAG: serine/threonine protein kinase [Labilithrix sp.]|nr:serine/threonine protein kinase [Labilithrix sp.]MCW5809781.1 serine/threonine protein kinase [Labilithrix sp.]
MADSDDELRARAEARVGTVLREKYTVEEIIGVGGMASVYAASHRNGRRVALKLLHPELSLRADLRKRFLREAQAANAVKHPGVVAVLDDDVAEDGAAFLVMELLDGQSVEELWEAHGKRLPTKAVLTLAADLCAVLAVAHDAGVIHRDLKPANLFVTEAGELKVLDFGIARVRDAATTSATSATSTGSVFGTPAFMAPEQAGGLVNELGPLTDLWAVGATMYTLLSGRPVHDGQSGQHIAILAATQPAASLASVLPEAPEDVVAIVDRALAFNKTDRWESAAAMRTALCEAQTRLPEPEATDDDTVVRGTLSETLLAVAKREAVAVRSGTLASPGNGAAFLGGTTGQPVSSEPITEDAPTRRRGSPKWRLMGLMGAVAAIAIAGVVATGVIVTTQKRAAETAPQATRSAQIPEATASPIAMPPELPLRSPPVAAAPAIAPVPNEPRPTVSASVRAAKPPVAPAARPRAGTTTPAPRLNCNPPFTSQDGIQVHKPGCP